MGSLYLSATDLSKAAKSVVETLNKLTGETISVGILNQGHVIMVLTQQALHHHRATLHVGSFLPAYTSAAGKALLSELSDSEIDDLFPDETLKPMAKKTIVSKTELKKELAQIRTHGISLDMEAGQDG